MNELDAIQFLAQVNSRFGRPLRREEVKENLPYFKIFKNDLRRYDIRGFNFEGHDNAPRMAFWEDYMRRKVLPHVNTALIEGYYNIELHDSYTYLENDKDYHGCLTFSKFKCDVGPILIPDPYAQGNWGGMLNQIRDEVAWGNKIDKVCFYGTTTGHRNPVFNQRLNMCLWSLKKPELYNFGITKIAQMTEDDVRTIFVGDTFDKLVIPRVSVMDQMRYKYHLVLDGNTCRFDIWNYLTNTVTLKYDSNEMLWYYPLLIAGREYIDVNKENMETKIASIDDRKAQFIIDNAKYTMSKIAQPLYHMVYLGSLFENMALNGK